MNDILGWLGNIGFLYGAYALGKRKLSGWIAQILANACYVIQSYFMHNIPLLVVSLILIGVNIYGYYSWVHCKKGTNVSLKKQCQNHAEHHYLTEVMKMHDNQL